MNNIMTDSIFFGAVISVVGYLIGIFLRKKISVLNPLLVSIIFVIAVIKIFHIDYETYNSGAKYLQRSALQYRYTVKYPCLKNTQRKCL